MEVLIATADDTNAPSSHHGVHDDDSISQDSLIATLKEAHFSSFVIKALVADYLLVAAGIGYSIWIDNYFHPIFGFVFIVQFWFALLIWSLCLPLPHRDHISMYAALVPVLALLLTGALGRSNGGKNWALDGVIWFLAIGLGSLMIMVALRYIRMCLKEFYTDSIRSKALQCTELTLRAGLLQTALLTTALVGYGGQSERNLLRAITRAYMANDGGQPVFVYTDNITTTNDTGVIGYFNTTEYDAKEDEEIVELALKGLQASLAGFALNMLLMQSIVSIHILEMSLVDLLLGNVLWLEYFSGFLQLVVVVAIASIIALKPADFAVAYSSAQRAIRGRMNQLVIGVFVPAMVLLFLLVYFSRALNRDSPTGRFIRQRHERIPPLEHRWSKINDSLTELGSQVTLGRQERERLSQSINELEYHCLLDKRTITRLGSKSTTDLFTRSERDREPRRSSEIAMTALERSSIERAQKKADYFDWEQRGSQDGVK